MHRESNVELALNLIFTPSKQFNRPIGDSKKRFVGFNYSGLEKNDCYLAGLMVFRSFAKQAAKKPENKARLEKTKPLLNSASVIIQTEADGFSAGFEIDEEEAGLSPALFMLEEFKNLAKEHILHSLVNPM